MCDENTVTDNETFLGRNNTLSRRRFGKLATGAALSICLLYTSDAADE